MIFMTKLNPKEHINQLEESDLSIKNRDETKELLKLCQLSQKDLDALLKIDDIMEEHAATIAERHYNMIMMIPEIKEIFNNNTNFNAYTTLITKYYQQLTKPTLDAGYIKYRKKIGQIHSRIHLTDEWFIGSYVRLYEYLFPLIVACFHSKPGELTDILTALNRIITFDTLVVLSSYQEANDFYLVENINKVMESVMGADKVGNLMDGVASTVEETSNINGAAQELSDSVYQVAENATAVSGNTAKMIEESKQGHDMIQGSLNGFLKMAEDFNQMKEKTNSLINNVKEITNVVELIQHIAEETNLLALNASIEAARAGESGRGFSVVASEIRGLAEQTKTSVNQISNTMKEIQFGSKDVGNTVEDMAHVLTSRVKQTSQSIDMMEKIMIQIKEVGDSTSNIAAIAEEQSAATEDITNRMLTIHKHMENIEEKAHATGQSIYDASVEVNELRREVMGVIPQLTSGQILRVTQTEHQLWGWWLYNKLLGYHTEDMANEIDISSSRLGKWIAQMNKEQAKVAKSPAFKTLEQLYVNFYNKIKEIYQLAERGSTDEAHKRMIEFESYSNDIMEQVENLQQVVSQFTI